MKNYACDLHERRVKAEQNRRRYWNNPAFRLAQVNKVRARYGRPPHESVEQIVSDYRARIDGRPRRANGTFA